MGSYTPTIKHRHEHGHNVCKNKQISVKKKDVWIRKKIKSDNNLVQQNNTAFALNTFDQNKHKLHFTDWLFFYKSKERF